MKPSVPLQRLCILAVKDEALLSTNDVARFVNAQGANANRAAVRNALRDLESRDAIRNIGDADGGVGDAWTVTAQ